MDQIGLTRTKIQQSETRPQNKKFKNFNPSKPNLFNPYGLGWVVRVGRVTGFFEHLY